MKKILILLVFFLFYNPSPVKAEFLDLPKDENGWTIFTPSEDSRIMYVSADGNDATGEVYTLSNHPDWTNPQNPTGIINAFATYEAAYANTRQGYPDWILFKRGDIFAPDISLAFINNPRSGRSKTEPFVIGAYGDIGASPVIRTNNKNAIRITSGKSFLAIFGLEFYANAKDPDNGGTLSSGSNGLYIYISEYGGPNYSIDALLIEGCKFRFYESNSIQNAWTGVFDIEIRRSTFVDNYSETAHSQGLYASSVNNLVFEENIMIHNGWYKQQIIPEENQKDDGQATEYNHNIYWGSVKNSVIRENIFIDASSGGIKLTGQNKTESTIIEDNLFIGNEIPISMGNNYQQPEYAFRFPNTIIEDNVVTHVGRHNPTNRNVGWGFWLCGLDGGSVSNNLLINTEPIATNNSAFSINSDESRNISWNNNIVYNYGFNNVFSISPNSIGSSNMLFTNNKIQLPGLINGNIVNARYDVRGEWSFASNTFFANSQTFNANGSNVDLTNWNSWSGDNSVWSEINFMDDTRDVDTYMASIEEIATINAFVEKARAQNRYNWNNRYNADIVNSWIREGFQIADYRADVDNSGGITTTDALLTLRNSLELSMNGTAWQVSSTTGDVNCDNISNSADALLILRYSLGLSMEETEWCE